MRHTNPPTENEVQKIFSSAMEGTDEVPSIVQILSELVRKGKRGENYERGYAEAIPSRMFSSFAIQSHAVVYPAERKALIQAGVNRATTYIVIPKK